MSAHGEHGGADSGTMSRRALVSALARWTVPTVLTLSLGARAAKAAASCPPCTKKVGGICRACTVSQILNCQCEPCLGAPYCPGAGPTAAFKPTSSTSPLGGQQPAPAGQQALDSWLRRRSLAPRDQFLPGFGGRSRSDSLFGGSTRTPYGRTPYGNDPRRPAVPRSLYDRLRPYDERR